MFICFTPQSPFSTYLRFKPPFTTMLKLESVIVSHNPIPETIFRPFWDKCAESPKRCLNSTCTTRSKIPVIWYTITPESQSHLFRPTAVTRHSETNTPNNTNMTFNIKRSKVPQAYITATPNSHISLRFPLRPAGFELQSTLGQLHWPKMTSNIPRSKCTPYMSYWAGVLENT